jgi:hypothetical protein
VEPRTPGAKETEPSGIGAAGWLGILVAIGLVVWLVLGVLIPAVDRSLRTETLDGIQSATGVHVGRDGRLVVADVAGGVLGAGRVIAVDQTSGRQEVLLEGQDYPAGADIGPSGTICAANQGTGGRRAGEASLRCSNGLRVDLAAFEEQNDPAGDGPESRPSDVVSDGADGWYVADAGAHDILHVDAEGRVRTIAVFPSLAGRAPSPLGIALDRDGMLHVALGPNGVVTLRPASAPIRVTTFIYAGGRVALAIVPHGLTPIVLATNPKDSRGEVGYLPGGFGPTWVTLLDGLVSPRGLALLPDGRWAISANDRVSLFRPSQTVAD